MPVYEYECGKCGRVIEAYQNFSDLPLRKCEHCSGKLQKLISQSTFHLKGTGWYVTDYAGKSGCPSSPEEKPKKASEGKAEKKDAKPTASKKGGGSGDSV